MSGHTANSSGSCTLLCKESSFLLRRIHSLTGIIPLGAFLLFHFFENASARHSAEAFNEAVIKISSLPYIYAIELCGLLGPLAFHAVYGLFIRTPSRQNVNNYGYWRNWAYFLQRATGVIAFAFIVYHVLATRGWSLFVKGDYITFADMHDMLSDPLILLFYALGVVAVTFHFANGIWSFCITWGIVTTQAAQKRLSFLTMIFFVILAVVGLDIAWTFSTKQSFLSFIG